MLYPAYILVLGVAVAGTIAYIGWGSDEDRNRRWESFFRSRVFKTGAIGALALSLTLPLWMMDGVIGAREKHYKAAVKNVQADWGKSQSTIGPMLIVPYEYRPGEGGDAPSAKRSGAKRTARGLAVFLPDELIVKSVVNPVRRKQGIFESPVYKSDINLSGRFGRPDFSKLAHRPTRIDWQGAYLSLGLGDTRAIAGQAQLRWDDRNVSLSQGMRYLNLQSQGLHARLPKLNSERRRHVFSLNISLNGSGVLLFAPLGKLTIATMQSRWPSPKFLGVLPAAQSVSSKGFSAEWRIPHLVRGFPQQWIVGQEAGYLTEMRKYETGVRLFEPEGFYLTIQRAMDFGIVQFGLVFLAFLLFEIAFGARIGMAQYLVVGGALCLFYLVLVALSEQVGFPVAYIWSSAFVIVAITLYSVVAIANVHLAIVCFALLTATYSSIFVLLHQPDYGLLFSAALLVAALVSVMYLTRNPSRHPSETVSRKAADHRGHSDYQAEVESAVAPAVSLVLGSEEEDRKPGHRTIASMLGGRGRDRSVGSARPAEDEA